VTFIVILLTVDDSCPKSLLVKKMLAFGFLWWRSIQQIMQF